MALIISDQQQEQHLVKRARTGSDLIIHQDIKRTSSLEAPIMLLTGHGSEIYSFRFNPNGKTCASGSFDKDIFLWNVYGQCENYGLLRGHKQAVLQVNWNGDGSELWSCSADHMVMLWDAQSCTRIRKMTEHKSYVNSVCPTLRGPQLAVSASDDRTVKTWDVRTKRSINTINFKYQVTAVAFSQQGEKFFTAGIDNVIKVWDPRKYEVEMELTGHTDTVTSLALSHDGAHLLSNAMDNTVCMWDIRPFVSGDRRVKQFLGAQHGFEKTLLRCNWSADDSRVACGSADRMVYVWDTQTAALLYKLPGHAGSVNEVDFHPKEPIIGSCGSDKKIFLGELEVD